MLSFAPYIVGMEKEQMITGYMRALLFAMINLASKMESGGEDFQVEMEVSGGEVTFDPVKLTDSKISEPVVRKALKLNEVLEDAGYPKVSGVLISVLADSGIGFSLGMEDEPSAEQEEIIASAFEGLDD